MTFNAELKDSFSKTGKLRIRQFDRACLRKELVLSGEDARYGLFKNLPDGPLWVCFEDNLEKAIRKISALSSSDGIEYFVVDLRTMTRVASTRNPKRGPTAG